MKKLKVMTIVGTRPEIIRLSETIKKCDTYFDQVLVHTGQNWDYTLNQVFFDNLELREPDHYLDAVGETLGETMGNIIAKSYEVLAKEKPDALLILGDTNSALSAIPAKRLKIPIFHMEAGNRCFDQRVPEELNRKVLDHLSDINMVLTEHARRYLLDEGIRPETIFKTGSHMREVLDYYQPGIEKSDILSRLSLNAQQYFLVSAHREENVDSPAALADLLDTLGALVEAYGFPVIVSTHPRTRKRLEEMDRSVLSDKIVFSKPFGFLDYVHLQTKAFCVLSDSGTITEESSLLNFPAITIRNAHERPEGMDVGTLIMSGLKRERVLDAVKVVASQAVAGGRAVLPVADYENPHVSKQVLRIVFSYVDYINRVVWSKP